MPVKWCAQEHKSGHWELQVLLSQKIIFALYGASIQALMIINIQAIS